MTRKRLPQRIALVLVGGLVLAGAMGQGCPSFTPGLSPVTVELINATADPVDAFLWADPELWFAFEDVAIDINFIDVGPSLVPGDIVTVTLDCEEAGTLLVDGDILVPGGEIPSSNLILLREGEHFFCGDIVSFYYEVDATGLFFISADVNDVTIAP